MKNERQVEEEKKSDDINSISNHFDQINMSEQSTKQGSQGSSISGKGMRDETCIEESPDFKLDGVSNLNR